MVRRGCADGPGDCWRVADRGSLPSPLLSPPTPTSAQEATSLPFQTGPHDALRQGLVTLKDGAAATHPVETIQRQAAPTAEAARLEMLQSLYGTALPARMQIERQILNRWVAEEWARGHSKQCLPQQASGVPHGGGCTAGVVGRALPA